MGIHSGEVVMMSKSENLEKEIEQTRNSLRSDRLDMSFGEIITNYEKGELIISPEFQRLYRWDLVQRTRFIESVLLGIPIPPIFVAEDRNGRWELVDGLQRVSTILSYFGKLKTRSVKANFWKMEEGNLLPALVGFTSKDMPEKYNLNIKRAVCRVEIIKWDSKWDMRYELFSRLNTGGTPLTEQEIRNSIFRSGLKKLYAFVDEAKQSEDFSVLVDVSEKKKQRLGDEELILRFVALVNSWRNVDSSMSVHLTTFMRDMLDRKDDIKTDVIKRFYNVMKILRPLGRDIFRVGTAFSTSLYDAITIGVCENMDYVENHPALLRNIINAIRSNNEFRQLRGGASSSTRTKLRLELTMKIIRKCIETHE